MRIKKTACLGPQLHIRHDLTEFYFSGYSTTYLGIPCELVHPEKPIDSYGPREAIYISFLNPSNGMKIIGFCMIKEELTYI